MEKDLLDYNELGYCPYCEGSNFANEVLELPDDEWVNTCADCGEKSIWSNNIQYKIKI